MPREPGRWEVRLGGAVASWMASGPGAGVAADGVRAVQSAAPSPANTGVCDLDCPPVAHRFQDRDCSSPKRAVHFMTAPSA
jgi:hypothetical protein